MGLLWQLEDHCTAAAVATQLLDERVWAEHDCAPRPIWCDEHTDLGDAVGRGVSVCWCLVPGCNADGGCVYNIAEWGSAMGHMVCVRP